MPCCNRYSGEEAYVSPSFCGAKRAEVFGGYKGEEYVKGESVDIVVVGR
jgi:hypothetical protein